MFDLSGEYRILNYMGHGHLFDVLEYGLEVVTDVTALELVYRSGSQDVMRYTVLTAVDREGTPVEIQLLQDESGGLEMLVDDSSGKYPFTIRGEMSFSGLFQLSRVSPS